MIEGGESGGRRKKETIHVVGTAWRKTSKAERAERLEDHTFLRMTETVGWVRREGEEVVRKPKHDGACIPCRVVMLSILKHLRAC